MGHHTGDTEPRMLGYGRGLDPHPGDTELGHPGGREGLPTLRGGGSSPSRPNKGTILRGGGSAARPSIRPSVRPTPPPPRRKRARISITEGALMGHGEKTQLRQPGQGREGGRSRGGPVGGREEGGMRDVGWGAGYGMRDRERDGERDGEWRAGCGMRDVGCGMGSGMGSGMGRGKRDVG